MDFGNPHLEELLVNFHSFHVEAFNIFALGVDQLPHLFCACPNRSIAQALCSLLESVPSKAKHPSQQRTKPSHKLTKIHFLSGEPWQICRGSLLLIIGVYKCNQDVRNVANH